MKFHLRSVVLWSKNPSLEPQIIPFEPGVVNVVTGNARTGKSAIIPIIDYCLCSSSCAIPRKAVRAACEWFGVLIETAEGQKLLARKNPGEHDAVEDMFVLEGGAVQIPHAITTKNTNAAHVKHDLDKLAGLSHLDFAGGEVFDRTDYRISFRDLMAFVFQPQNVVANRDILFYRSEKLEYKNKLARNTLPYVLGAVTPDILLAQHEHERSLRKLKRKEAELAEIQKASARWETQMNAHLSRAEELGLHTDVTSGQTSPESVLALLRSVADKTVEDFQADGTTITGAVERQIELEASDDKLSTELAELKSRQEDLSRLRDGAGGYRDALVVQKERLAVSEWLASNASEDAQCPICGNAMSGHIAVLGELKSHLEQVEQAASQIEEMPVAVDRDIQHIRKAMDDTADKLREIRREKRMLTSNSEAAQKRQFHALTVAHFLGQLSAALTLHDQAQADGELSEEIERLRADLRRFSAQIDHGEIERRKGAALARVSAYIARFMPQLDNDHGDNAAELDIANLTLKISGAEGQSQLWSIGSGSNHLSYHISTLLALHRFFLDGQTTTVPSLLVFDQPSQVYFPEKIHADDSTSAKPWDNDKDVEAVRKIFTLLNNVVDSVHERLQVIVLDHAPPNVWGELPVVHLAANWHSGQKLVPAHWPGVDD